MPFRNLVAEPEALRELSAAFDEAWGKIGPDVSPILRSATREYLGALIVGLWQQDGTDNLAGKAVAKYWANPRIFLPWEARHDV